MPKQEFRTFKIGEVRETESDGKTTQTVTGYAAVFNQLSDDLGGFREQIAPGAFTNSIKTDDIRALINHDPNQVLGRNTADTLRLNEDDRGLAVEIDLPDTQDARDLAVQMKRGDIDQMSFGFFTAVDGDTWTEIEGEPIRTLLKAELFDVSIVTFPAYPQTSAGLNALSFDNTDAPLLAQAAIRASHGLTLNDEHREALETYSGNIQSLIKTSDIPPEPKPGEEGDPPDPKVRCEFPVIPDPYESERQRLLHAKYRKDGDSQE